MSEIPRENPEKKDLNKFEREFLLRDAKLGLLGRELEDMMLAGNEEVMQVLLAEASQLTSDMLDMICNAYVQTDGTVMESEVLNRPELDFLYKGEKLIHAVMNRLLERNPGDPSAVDNLIIKSALRIKRSSKNHNNQ